MARPGERRSSRRDRCASSSSRPAPSAPRRCPRPARRRDARTSRRRRPGHRRRRRTSRRGRAECSLPPTEPGESSPSLTSRALRGGVERRGCRSGPRRGRARPAPPVHACGSGRSERGERGRIAPARPRPPAAGPPPGAPRPARTGRGRGTSARPARARARSRRCPRASATPPRRSAAEREQPVVGADQEALAGGDARRPRRSVPTPGIDDREVDRRAASRHRRLQRERAAADVPGRDAVGEVDDARRPARAGRSPRRQAPANSSS